MMHLLYINTTEDNGILFLDVGGVMSEKAQ